MVPAEPFAETLKFAKLYVINTRLVLSEYCIICQQFVLALDPFIDQLERN